MRAGKMIGFLTMILAVLILLAGIQGIEPDEKNISLFFSVKSEMGAEDISCWENEAGEFYVFIPGYAELEQVSLASGNALITIGDVSLEDGMPCKGMELNRRYPFTYTNNGYSVNSFITFVKSDNIPTLHIDVQSGSMEYIHLDKNHEERGDLRLYDPEGKLLYSGAISALKGRGNTSWYAEKKPYNLTLLQEADFLGMGAANEWILLAEGGNALNIRNKIVYDFADHVGLQYSPDCEWVDLYLNGEYAGLYLLTERNEIHRERVGISKEKSFLISMENQSNMDNQKIPYVALDSTQVLRIRYASVDTQEIEQLWSALWKALHSEDGIDPESGKHWKNMIDLDSWVKKYLIEELFANPDGGAVSQYFYYDGTSSDGRIHAGPVWDYDYAMGGESFWMREYPSFLVLAREYTDDGMYLPWFYKLYRQEAFYSRLTEVYESEFVPQLERLLSTEMSEYASVISAAVLNDGIRWSNSEQEILADYELIAAFLENRMQFLSDLWIEQTSYHIVRVNSGRSISGYFAVRDGDVLPELPDYESVDGLGWYNAETDELVDIKQPIYDDMHICIKKQEANIPLIHFVPIFAVGAVLLLICFTDIIRAKKSRTQKYHSVKSKG